MARDPGRAGCAAETAERGDALIGTASRVRRWLLVEQPGPWGAAALHESRLDAEVADRLGAAARRAGVRVVLIRRPRWAPVGDRRLAFLVHTEQEHRWIEQVEVQDPAELLDIDLDLLAEDAPPGIGEPGPEALHLVCTNGRHDPCCADLGRPVVRALADAGVPEVWESSHIGGDRFAANVVCLPRGTYFGRVPPEHAARILRDHASGVVDLERYRGRSCFPPLVQAAEGAARRRLDEPRLDALRMISAQRTGDDSLAVVFDHDEAGRVEVDAVRERGEPQLLTCSGGPSSPWRYRAERVQVPDPR